MNKIVKIFQDNMKAKLPISIKVIGWVYTAVGALAAMVGLLLGIGVGIIGSIFSIIIGAAGGFAIGVVFVIIGLAAIWLGQSLMLKNKTAWWVAIIIAVLGIFGALNRRKGLDMGAIIWNVFVIWKLYERRKLFEKKWIW